MSGQPGAAYLAVDVGKTWCRLRLGSAADRGAAAERSGPGAVGLSHPDGDAALVATVRRVLGPELERRARGAHGCVAAAGHLSADLGMDVARLLVDELGLASCAVTSDAVAAHVGAFDGLPGVVLAAGTGAVAVGVSPDRGVHVVDGVGQWLGDEGSGAWIGLEGLRAAIRERDGRGPQTRLRRAAEQEYGDLDLLPVTLEESGSVPREAARFAPVLARIAADDDIAASIIARAAEALATTAIAAARRSAAGDVAFVGGLAGLGRPLLDPWGARVETAGLRVVQARGTALDGAARLSLDGGLPHEGRVSRVAARPGV